MKSLSLVLLFAAILSLSSCQLAGDIFKTGVGVGIFIVVFIVAIVVMFIAKAAGGK